MHQSESRYLAKYLAASALLVMLAGCASTHAPLSPETKVEAHTGPQPLVFAATGDGPRGPEDWTLLPQYFAAEQADGRARYMLHTGDLCKGSQTYDSEYSARVKDLFLQSPIPTIFVVGDNEWNDQPDPWASWPLWERDFLHFHNAYPSAPETIRQPERPENIAWLDDGVLFIGLNLVGGFMHDVEEWAYRHRDNAEWVENCLKTHGGGAYAAVVFAQAAPDWKHEDFMKPFVQSVKTFGKPVLYLHGDHHNWEHEPGWRAPNMTRVQVDQVTKARPVHVIVSPDNPAQPFSFDRHGAGEATQKG